MKWRSSIGFFALAVFMLAQQVEAQLLGCSCLSTQAVLFTNTCCGLIPDLCGPANKCYSSTIVPSPGFTCTQNPLPGTPVCSSTPITFTLLENITGNSAVCTVTFNVGVSTNVFTALCPPTQLLPCDATNWTFGPPGWTNTCCTVGMVTNVVSVVTNWPVITTTWTIIDGCSVAATCSQSIAFSGSNGPCACLGIICPPDIVLQTCLPPFSSAGGFTNVSFPLPAVTNSCIGVITNVFYLPPSGSPFPVGTNVVTGVVQDSLGNSNVCHFNVVVLGDTTPPIITCPPPQTNICGSTWAPIKPTAVDACCGTSVTVSLVAVFTNTFAPCDNLITFKWVATDCNGNQSAPCMSTVHVIDPIPPVLSCRGNFTLQCGSPLLPPPATDNCCPNPAVTMLNVITNGTAPCNYKLTITWQAQDCCTNTDTCTEVISIIDTTPPVLTCAPNKTIQCGAPWSFDPPSAFDACCGSNLTVAIVVTTTNTSLSPCVTTATRQWQATDCCGNASALCSQTVTIVDTTPPVITCATNKTVQCGSAWSFDPPTAIDGCCGTNVTITVLSTLTNNPTPCPGTITRTWRATDCCNNSATCSQTVTNRDTTPPVLTCASNITVAVGSPWTFTPPTAVDACCGTNVTITILATVTNYDGTTCQMLHRRLWRASDCCNNAATCIQTVAVRYGPPPNDLCANAFPLSVNSGYLCGNNLCATPSAPASLIPAPCGGSVNARDVWYRVVAPCTGPMTVDTCAPCPDQPPFDTVLSAYTGTCPGTLTMVSGACNDNAPGCGLRSSITFNVLAGQTYLLRVAGAGNAVGWFSLQAQLTSPGLTNDFCAGAITLVPGTPTCGSTICATPSQPWDIFPAPCGNSLNTPDVWYQYTPTCPQFVTINTCGLCPGGPNYNTVLSVYTGNCGVPPLSQVVCNDDVVGGFLCAAPQSQVTFLASAGVTYYVRVSGAGPGAVGSFRLNVTIAPGPPPPNDVCATATAITPGAYPWNNCFANTDGPFGNGCTNPIVGFPYTYPYQDVWFKYTAPCAGAASVSACESTTVLLEVFSGTCANLNLLGCSWWGGFCPAYPGVSFNTTPGATYYIRLGSFLSPYTISAGMLTLVGPNPPAPTCPPPGACSPRYFRITGTPGCIPWGWSLKAPCCMNLQNLNATPVCGGDADTFAAAFVNSINAASAAAGCGTLAVAYPSLPGQRPAGRFGICTTCTGANQFVLGVGAAGSPLLHCIVPNPGGYAAIPVGWCAFNPEIAEIPLSGHDLNNNGTDDGFDIEVGTSQDVNGNGIPDEVEHCLPPALALEPQSQVVESGAAVTLSVALGGGTAPLSYAWSRDGSPLTDGPNISGASSASLTLNAMTATDAGHYSVAVTNLCGAVATTPAMLSLAAQVLPVLYDMNLTDGWFHFSVETRIGFGYRIEYKNNLDDSVWTILDTIPGTGQPQLILDSEPLPQTRFYRVSEQTPP
jgi:hypothetical protein